jgi:hypothetical protein
VNKVRLTNSERNLYSSDDIDKLNAFGDELVILARIAHFVYLSDELGEMLLNRFLSDDIDLETKLNVRNSAIYESLTDLGNNDNFRYISNLCEVLRGR